MGASILKNITKTVSVILRMYGEQPPPFYNIS